MLYAVKRRVSIIALLASLAVCPTVAPADEAEDALIRAETQIETLNAESAVRYAERHYDMAKLRLEEARSAEDDGRDEEAVQRVQEARLHADIVKVKTDLGALTRTREELENALKVLQQELN